MALDDRGDLRPIGATLPRRSTGSERTRPPLAQYCPGVLVTRPEREAEAAVDPDFGNWIAAWVGHAADESLRYRGSSGGALSALVAYALDTGVAARASMASGSGGTRSSGVVVASSTESAACTASRYAPASSLAALAAAGNPLTPGTLVVGRPCESSAVRQAGLDPDRSPLLLSFFCAGVPSQRATDQLVEKLGLEPSRVISLRYRGHGWPGNFRVTDDAGTVAEVSYEDSWGSHLGRDLQSRCKICVDGVGESADVVAGDVWDSDARGFPVFDDAPGRSIIIARTARGLALVEGAVAAGYLVVEPSNLQQSRVVQRYQVTRRRYLLARVLGRSLARKRSPRFRRFGLLGLALAHPRESVRQARGSYARARNEANG